MTLREVDKRGVPQVKQWYQLPDHAPVWGVEYPDLWEWDCCRDTNLAWFSTWVGAVTYALDRTWERNDA